jgi:hypothetical protein
VPSSLHFGYQQENLTVPLEKQQNRKRDEEFGFTPPLAVSGHNPVYRRCLPSGVVEESLGSRIIAESLIEKRTQMAVSAKRTNAASGAN